MEIIEKVLWSEGLQCRNNGIDSEDIHLKSLIKGSGSDITLLSGSAVTEERTFSEPSKEDFSSSINKQNAEPTIHFIEEICPPTYKPQHRAYCELTELSKNFTVESEIDCNGVGLASNVSCINNEGIISDIASSNIACNNEVVKESEFSQSGSIKKNFTKVWHKKLILQNFPNYNHGVQNCSFESLNASENESQCPNPSTKDQCGDDLFLSETEKSRVLEAFESPKILIGNQFDEIEPSTQRFFLTTDATDESLSPVRARKKKNRPNFFEDSESEDEVDQIVKSEDKRSSENILDTQKEKPNVFISDFDQMLQRKKNERFKARKRQSIFLTKNDDLIDHLIDRMEEAAYEDRHLNSQGLPATKKVSMLKYVLSQLIKKNLQHSFLEHNILNTLTEWLSPLPSNCLPCLQIREGILKILDDFPTISSGLLKQSGIGKALMYLRKHPKETKENKERCNRLIAQWARPIHNLTCDYRAMSKKERQERDVELSLRYKKKTFIETTLSPPIAEKQNIVDFDLKSIENKRTPRPNERGWVPRARVPMPSTKDYVKRPKPQVECSLHSDSKPNRYEMLAKKYQNAKRVKHFKGSSAKLSIVGDKMQL